MIPAIDLLDGSCVRLAQGRYEDATVYESDPAAQVQKFLLPSPSLQRLHVVDLDGAKAGEPKNQAAIQSIVTAAGKVPVQLGGGLRNLQTIEASLALGIDRVILGTVALRDPALVKEAAKKFPGKIVVGLDGRNGKVAVEGWLETSNASVTEVAQRFEDVGVAAIVYTDIARDGMQTGPNVKATQALAKNLSIPVIASGGVGSLKDVEAVAAYRTEGIAGVIVGRALYTGELDLSQALEVASCC